MEYLEPREGYDRFARDYRKEYTHLDSFDWEKARPLLWEAIDSVCNATSGSAAPALLDAGCGDGRVLGRVQRHLKERDFSAELWGWDLSPGMLKAAVARLEDGPRLVCRDIEDPVGGKEAPVQRFSLVWAFFVLVHLTDTTLFFSSLRAAMADKGTIILNNIPQKEGFQVKYAGKGFVIEYYHHEDAEITEALEKSGWTVDLTQAGEWSTLIKAHVTP